MPVTFQHDGAWYRVTAIGNNAFENGTGLAHVMFEDPTGWVADNVILTEDELTNTEKAAEYLRAMYALKTWARS